MKSQHFSIEILWPSATDLLWEKLKGGRRVLPPISPLALFRSLHPPARGARIVLDRCCIKLCHPLHALWFAATSNRSPVVRSVLCIGSGPLFIQIIVDNALPSLLYFIKLWEAILCRKSQGQILVRKYFEMKKSVKNFGGFLLSSGEMILSSTMIKLGSSWREYHTLNQGCITTLGWKLFFISIFCSCLLPKVTILV